ncbi:unnamed protein product [Pedinophyceae sp. YPF-701]|nr:unnamed protein product [Pedinophyceae sp. YPF-701]
MFFSLGISKWLCTLVALLYPTYASVVAIKSADPADDRQWLTYWIVYAFLGVFETLLEYFLSYVPFYFEAKLIFLLWLASPQFRGAQFVYERFIEPFMTKYVQPRAQPYVANLEAIMNNDLIGMVGRVVENHGEESIARVAKLVEQYGPQALESVQSLAEQQLKQMKAQQEAAGKKDT